MKKIVTLIMVVLTVFAVKAEETVTVAELDFSSAGSYSMWTIGPATPVIQNGALFINNTTEANFWDLQYFVLDNFPVVSGVEYTVTAKVKGYHGNLPFNIGTWDATFGGDLNFSDSNDWQTVSKKLKSTIDASNAHLNFQTGHYTSPYSIAYVAITYVEAISGDEYVIPLIVNGNLATDDESSFCLKIDGERQHGFINNGEMVIDVPERTVDGWPWETQLCIMSRMPLKAGYKYQFSCKVKSSSSRSILIHANDGPDNFVYSYIAGNEIPVTDEWKKYLVTEVVPTEADGFNVLALNLSTIIEPCTIYFKELEWNFITKDPSQTSIGNVIAEQQVNHWIVYNMLGVKVLDTDEESDVYNLTPGLYIVNGKKIVIRK